MLACAFHSCLCLRHGDAIAILTSDHRDEVCLLSSKPSVSAEGGDQKEQLRKLIDLFRNNKDDDSFQLPPVVADAINRYVLKRLQ